MTSRDPGVAIEQNTSTPSRRNLWLRVVSAAVLAPLAIGAAYLGDWPFTIFWLLAALAVWWEWVRLVRPTGAKVVIATGACVLVLEAVIAGFGTLPRALFIIGLGLMAAIVTAGRQAAWIGGGIVYASALLMAPLVLRADPLYGFAALIFLFALVWGTDIGGYFAGRSLGGPKLLPAISPKKTWSGAIGGTLVGTSAAAAAIAAISVRISPMLVVTALVLSISSQAGDLFESALKRRFDAKDASGLIPGHGGVMDRLDGFIFAAALAAVIGVLRGGFENAGAGLLVW